MPEIPDDVIVYGFAFAPELTDFDMKELEFSLECRNIAPECVVFSAWSDAVSDCVWILAANKYVDDDGIKNSIEYIIENNVDEEYCLVNSIV